MQYLDKLDIAIPEMYGVTMYDCIKKSDSIDANIFANQKIVDDDHLIDK